MLLEEKACRLSKMEERAQMDISQQMDNYYSQRRSSFSDRSADSPLSDKVSSAADAMLKLSTSYPVFVHGHDEMSREMKSEPEDGSDQFNDGNQSDNNDSHRRERAFVPEVKKDDHYWVKRRKNNEAAKKSREKRRMQDQLLSQNVDELKSENDQLKVELEQMKRHFRYPISVKFDPHLAQLVNKREEPIVIRPVSPIERNSTQADTPVSPTSTPMLPLGTVVPTPSTPSTLMPLVVASLLHRQYSRTEQDLPQNEHVYSSRFHESVVSTPESADNFMDSKINRKRKNSDDIPLDYSSHLKVPRVDNGDHCNGSNMSPDHTANMRVNEHKGIPHKLRHKYNSLSFSGAAAEDWMLSIEQTKHADSEPEPYAESPDVQFVSGDKHSVPADLYSVSGDKYSVSADLYSGSPHTHSVSADTYSVSDSDQSIPGSTESPTVYYSERRKRNNLAARKCRQNQRRQAQLQTAKAELLEDENSKLKGEMQHLSGEVEYLKDLIRTKTQAQTNGDRFEPPVLDKLDQRDNA